jgi:hypothetical protein
MFSKYELTIGNIIGLRATLDAIAARVGIPGFDGEDGLDSIMIPGPIGLSGSNGLPGIYIPSLDGEDGEIGFPGRQGADGPRGQDGRVIWLDPEQSEESIFIPWTLNDIIIANRTLQIFGLVATVYPDQTRFLGSVAFGNGLQNSVHNSGVEGQGNTAVGISALLANTTGDQNVAVGNEALLSNLVGVNNTAVGYRALRACLGDLNVALGQYALYNLSSGTENLGIGRASLLNITTSSYNVAIGSLAGRYQANGTTVLAAASYSIYIGYNARGFDDSDNNSIVIGANAAGIGANTVVIGNADIVTTLLKGTVVHNIAQTSSIVANSLGGYNRQLLEATGTPSGTTTYFDIAVNVPSGCKLLGCQLRVDTALTAGETWGAAYITGSTTVIAAAGQAVAKNTKVNKMHVDEITSATTKVRITRDAGNFTNGVGVIRAIVYYETFTAMGTL